MKMPRVRKVTTPPELPVGLTLTAIVATISFGVFSATRSDQLQAREITDPQSDLRVVAARMSSELRSAGGRPRGDDPHSVPFEAIAAATSGSIRFRSDLDGDGAIDGAQLADEDVLYSWDSETQKLYRVTDGGWTVVLGGVEGFAIHYFGDDGRELVAPLNPSDRLGLRSLRIDFNVRGADGTVRDWSTTTGFRNDLQGSQR